jgi:hypothetical protein
MAQNFFAVKSSGFPHLGGGDARPVMARVMRARVNKGNDPRRPPCWTEYVKREETLTLALEFGDERAPEREWTEDKALSAIMRWEDADKLARELGGGAHALVVSQEEDRSDLAAGGRRMGDDRPAPSPARARRMSSETSEDAQIERCQAELQRRHLD